MSSGHINTTGHLWGLFPCPRRCPRGFQPSPCGSYGIARAGTWRQALCPWCSCAAGGPPPPLPPPGTEKCGPRRCFPCGWCLGFSGGLDLQADALGSRPTSVSLTFLAVSEQHLCSGRGSDGWGGPCHGDISRLTWTGGLVLAEARVAVPAEATLGPGRQREPVG